MPVTTRSRRQASAATSSSEPEAADASISRGATPESAALLLEDGGLVVNILGALDAHGLATMCCTSQPWAAAEKENRRTLWRNLALKRWPELGLGRQVDWRNRYRVLLQNGKPNERDKAEDPLADYTFVIQGRWEGDARETPAFSGSVAAQSYSATISLHGNALEFKDAFQLDLQLQASLPLRPTGATGPGAASFNVFGPADTALEVTVCTPVWSLEPRRSRSSVHVPLLTLSGPMSWQWCSARAPMVRRTLAPPLTARRSPPAAHRPRRPRPLSVV